MREITIDHKDIQDSNAVTPVTEQKFKENGLDVHQHEVESMDDDFSTGKRHLKVKNTKYFHGSALFKERFDEINWT